MDYSKQKKQDTALVVEQMVTVPITDGFSVKNAKMKVAKLKNLSSAMARYSAEDDRLMTLVTLTFGADGRINFQRMPLKKIKAMAKIQYNSLISFVEKMRRSKRFKDDIRYFAVVEVQPEGGALHAHISVSVNGIDEMFALVEFIQYFKGRYKQPYIFKSKQALPIGRSHIGVSSMLEKEFKQKYTLESYAAKGDSSRIEHYMPELEQREFRKGDWTPIEFYTKSMIEDRYSEQIADYLIKTAEGELALDSDIVKEGVRKCQLSHDTKSLLDMDNYINKLHVLFVRLVGRVYTHSRFPFPWSLYQQHRKSLIIHNPKYKIFYSCIESIRNGELIVDGGIIFDGARNIIAGGKDEK